jgi:hypothetical protein
MLKSWKRAGITIVATGVTVLGLSGLALVPPALAAAQQAPAAVVVQHGGGGGLRTEAGLEAAAQALGMTADELRTQLWAGESLADLADAAGVELQVVRDAVTAANLAATRDAITEAVADGTLTQAKADWLIEGLDAGYWGGEAGGFGFGGPGFGGHGGPRFFGGGRPGQDAPDAQPTTVAPTNES